MTTPHSLWTIDELGAQVALALAVDYGGAPSGRVRDVPDLRTIRYYTTLGLLDRPAQLRGRTALYGRRHLLQLVAIKRLQARGLALADIQQRLVGLTDAALVRLANLPAETAQRRRDTESQRLGPSAPREFWKEAPAAFVSMDAAVEPGQTAETVPASLRPCVPAALVPLAEGVTLLLESTHAPDDEDIQAIRTVAAPLLKLLDMRRLRARAEKGNTHDQTTARAD